MSEELKQEKERIKEEAIKTIAYILKDKREGKVKNKAYPIKKICRLMYALYGFRDADLIREAENLSLPKDF